MRSGQSRREQLEVLAGAKIGCLPGPGKGRGQRGDAEARFDDHGEELFVEAACQRKFFAAPIRRKPVARDKKNHRLAALRSLMELTLPALACGDAAFGIEVKKNIGPAFGCQPIGKRLRFEIIAARMTDENL